MKNITGFHLLAVLLLVSFLSMGMSVFADGTDGYIRIAKSSGPTNYDASSNGITLTNNLEIFETLVESKNLKWSPLLATSWKQSDDKTWEFTLRDGVKFHDGTPLNAETVKKSLEHALDKNPTLVKLLNQESISTSGDNTVIIKTKDPNMFVPAVLTYTNFGIMSPSSIDASGTVTSSIGTGPMKLKELDPTTGRVVVEKNTGYWGGDIKAKGIVFEKVPDANTRAIAIENDEFDITHSIPNSEIKKINDLEGVTVALYERPNAQRLDCNLNHAVLQDQKVRQAISYAIDRNALCKDVMFDTASPAAGVVNPVMPWANPALKLIPYDPAKSKVLLDEAGWKDSDGDGIRDKDGKPLSLVYLATSTSPYVPALSDALADEMKDVGIKLEVNLLESGAVTDKRNSGDWDLMWSSSTAGMIPDPGYPMNNYFATGSPSNYGNYSNAVVDVKLKEGDRVSGQENRNRAYDDVQQIIYDELPTIPVFYAKSQLAYNDRVKGISDQELIAHDFLLYPGTYI
nr:ABC transporter substrate-binding protein [uncultured Methanospirillum sp.]